MVHLFVYCILLLKLLKAILLSLYIVGQFNLQQCMIFYKIIMFVALLFVMMHFAADARGVLNCLFSSRSRIIFCEFADI